MSGRALWVAACVLASSACVRVQAWERGVHAKRCMQLSPDPTAVALEQHVFDYREGAAGGYDAMGGSGCGCN